MYLQEPTPFLEKSNLLLQLQHTVKPTFTSASRPLEERVSLQQLYYRSTLPALANYFLISH